MGFLNRTDELKQVVEQLGQQLADQRQDHKDQIDKLIQQINDQNVLLRELLDQYINRGTNTNESLNARVERKDQYLKEPEWEPLGNDPFEGF